MLEITLTQFTPAQVEKIAGVAVDQQRNLRRHGYLAQTEGHARFDGFGLARLAAIKHLSDRGIGPALTAKAEGGFDIATLCATGILWRLLDKPEAYEGDHFEFELSGPPVVPLDPHLFDQVIAEAKNRGMDEEALRTALLHEDRGWSSRASILKRQVMSDMGLGRVIPARYFIWWADGSHLWHEDLNVAFEGKPDDPRYQGAVMVMDQEAVASALLSQAGTAFAHIEGLNSD